MREEQEFRKLVWLTKVLIVVMLALFIVEFMSCAKANAGVITGDKALCGLSWAFEKCVEQNGKVPYPEGIELLAEVMYNENFCNGDLVMYYTGAVVMNRVNAKYWPNTVKDVLYQDHPKQYATTYKFYTKPIPESVYHLACKVAKGTPDVPKNVVYQAMFKQGKVWKHEKTEYFCFGRTE